MLFFLLACTTTKVTDTAVMPTTCVDQTNLVSTFELFPTLPTTQIHADSAFDGEWIWTVFNLPNEDGKFDVYLGAHDCAGTIVVEPEQILPISGMNQTTPRIAISGKNILVASQGDNGSSANNLSIHLHLQSRDGTIITEREWTPIIEQEETGNRWLPSIAGYDDGFWLAGAVANTQHFRTAVQQLDNEGNDVGQPFWAGPNEYAVFPNIDGDATGFVVGWDTGNDSIMWTTGTGEYQNEPVEQLNAASAKVLWHGSETSPDIFANKRAPLTVQWNDSAISQYGNTHYPNAAKGETSTLMTHFRIQSGYSNDIFMAALQENDVWFQDELIQSDPAVAPYRPAITHIEGNTYFVAWSQGANPDFLLAGQFINLDAMTEVE